MLSVQSGNMSAAQDGSEFFERRRLKRKEPTRLTRKPPGGGGGGGGAEDADLAIQVQFLDEAEQSATTLSLKNVEKSIVSSVIQCWTDIAKKPDFEESIGSLILKKLIVLQPEKCKIVFGLDTIPKSPIHMMGFMLRATKIANFLDEIFAKLDSGQDEFLQLLENHWSKQHDEMKWDLNVSNVAALCHAVAFGIGATLKDDWTEQLANAHAQLFKSVCVEIESIESRE